MLARMKRTKEGGREDERVDERVTMMRKRRKRMVMGKRRMNRNTAMQGLYLSDS